MMRRRGIVLIVVLAIIAVLGVLAGTFAFRMNAELAAVKASQDLQQARLAARSGIDRMIHVLRTGRTNVDMWYDNPDDFRRVPVWVEGDETLSASPWEKDAVPGVAAWRYSIVSYRDTGPGAKDVKMRYGLTDEASKINIANLANKALRAQVLSLLDQLQEQVRRDNLLPEMLADSLIDWQDPDDAPISSNGAENEYYYTHRSPRYRAKNRPLQSIDELLMIRGFDGLVLYGEDANRNGYLDANEDDGGNEIDIFPPDNGDGKLYRGLLPYITVFSWDWNTAIDNKPKIPLNSVSMQMLEQPQFQYLTLEIRPEIIEFIAEARQRGYQFRSVGELLGLEVYENGKSNYTKAWREYDELIDYLNEDRKDTGEGEGEGEGEGQGGAGNESADHGGGGPADNDQGDGGGPGKSDRRRQSARPDRGDRSSVEENDDAGGEPTAGNQDRQGNRGRGGDRRSGDRASDGDNQNDDRDGRPDRPRTWSQQQRDRSERRRNRGPQVTIPGDQDEDELVGTPLPNPITAADMIAICDRFTVETTPVIPGLINVNTASVIVLQTIPGISPEQAAAIVAQREQISGDQKTSIGWLVANGVLDAETFALVSNMLTTRSIQFSADVIGFADHTGTFKRFEVVVEMRGHLAQIVYFRDISSLGAGYPVWNDEQGEGLSYDDL
ncbi:MAG: helix-hairpin-helix domain-containing protein [Phycisphaerae bacterium]